MNWILLEDFILGAEDEHVKVESTFTVSDGFETKAEEILDSVELLFKVKAGEVVLDVLIGKANVLGAVFTLDQSRDINFSINAQTSEDGLEVFSEELGVVEGDILRGSGD